MIQEVLYSDLNPGIITKWKIQEGRRVTENDILCEYKGLKLNKVKSQFAGLITKILKKENESVKLGDVLAIMEKCSHTTVWRNVCADCGTMMESQAATGPSTKFVAMMHCVPDLLVSEENALELGRKDKNVLLQRKRLALLVDLDQTIIHTTNDNVPPNLKDVYHFQLQHGREGRKWWYHTKLRPHTERFLKKISEYYELHICTFGVRSYAHAIAGYLDPERKYFQHRILSRDECFHPNLKTLNLKNLFPCGDTMVCIIDDREDVWKSASNMIRVKPYSFFDGSADINAPPLAAKSGQIKEKEPRKQRIIRVPNKKPEAAEEDKPSDENDEQSSDASKAEEFTEMIEWEDSDDYLLHLERILIKIHDSYYKQYEDNSYNPETCNLDLKSIVPSEKMKVLQGCNILFSGVIPLKQKLETSWAYRLAVNFGATVQTELVLEGGSNVTTHVIGMRDGTEKIKKAYKHKIFVVNVDWLLDSIERWEKADESLYPISKEPSHNYLLYCAGGGQQPEEAAPKEEHVEIDEKWRSEILDLCRSAVEEMSDDSDDDDEPVTRKRRHSEDLDELEENPKQMHLELEEEDLNSDENSCNEDSDCCDEGNDYCQDYVNDDDDDEDD